MATYDSTRRRTSGVPTGGGGDSTSISTAQEIPDKLYFRIGEVARLCDLPTHVLRFWESEFTQLRPNKGGTGQRLYRRRDVEMVFRIKSLLYERGYTIPGARQAFKQEVRAAKNPQLVLGEGEASGISQKQLRSLQKDLRELHAVLSMPVSRRISSRSGVQPIRRAKTGEAVAVPASTSGERLFD